MVRKGEGGLDRETIVAAAVTLLNEVGLDGLTLRRLGQELGVQAPALYWHVRNKRELLDHMAAALLLDSGPDTRPAPGQTWDEWLVARAHGQRRSLLAHRDGARLVAGARPIDSIFPVLEKMLESLVAEGFTPARALRAITIISMYVGGFVLEEQAEQSRWTEGDMTAIDVAAMEHLRSNGQWPLTVAAFEEGGDPNGDAAFADGLALIIDGLRAQHARSPRG